MAAVIAGLALLWSLFQLWIASPLPFILGFGVLNDTETRSIHGLRPAAGFSRLPGLQALAA